LYIKYDGNLSIVKIQRERGGGGTDR